MKPNTNELQKKADEIRKSCQHWLSCQDGSYEMALSMAGYFKILRQIKKESI